MSAVQQAAAADSRWRAPQAGAIEWREWDGDVVVYVDSTAATHQLSAAASAVLMALLAEPGTLTAAGLFAQLFAEGMPMSADEQASLHTILLDLERRGLAQLADV